MKTEPNDTIDYNPAAQQCTGLTKREYMAIEFTKAYIICPGNKQPLWVDDNAKQGLLQADSLIEHLNSF